MRRRAQEGSQTFLTAIILMVASERRMAADWFTRALMEGFAQRCKSKKIPGRILMALCRSRRDGDRVGQRYPVN